MEEILHDPIYIYIAYIHTTYTTMRPTVLVYEVMQPLYYQQKGPACSSCEWPAKAGASVNWGPVVGSLWGSLSFVVQIRGP